MDVVVSKRPFNELSSHADIVRHLLSEGATDNTPSLEQRLDVFVPDGLARFHLLGGNCVAQAKFIAERNPGGIAAGLIARRGQDPLLDFDHLAAVSVSVANGRKTYHLADSDLYPTSIPVTEGVPCFWPPESPEMKLWIDGGELKVALRVDYPDLDAATPVPSFSYPLEAVDNPEELITLPRRLLHPELDRIVRRDATGAPVASLYVNPIEGFATPKLAGQPVGARVDLRDAAGLSRMLTPQMGLMLGINRGRGLADLSLFGAHPELLEGLQRLERRLTDGLLAA